MKIFQFLLLLTFFLISCQDKGKLSEKDSIIQDIQQELGVTFEQSIKDFNNPTTGSAFSSQYYSIEFDHAKITDNTKLIYTFIDIFEKNNFEQNIDYSADGPTGSAIAYSKDNQTYVVFIEWSPPEGAIIPDDEPLDLSKFSPEQIVYFIEVYSFNKGK